MKIFLAILSAFLMVACSDREKVGFLPDEISSSSDDTNSSSSSGDAETPAEELKADGMLLVKGSADTVRLGTNLKSALDNEKPEMKVLLDYDFLLDRHEVTCKEFLDVMKSPELSESVTCESDSLPIAEVTYFDAALFANEKSKAKGLDTVYEYSKKTLDESGHCTQLAGFAFHLDRDGFRLPTEAEWVKAAAKNFQFAKSFNNSNSGYKAHAVCGLEKDSTAFCDLSGNLMEWVNDFMGNLSDTTISNFAGAPSQNGIGERILKGGHFALDTASTRLYSRGDVYTVTAATSADYVGFRMAKGKIPNAAFLDESGKVAKTSIQIPAQSFDLNSFTGTSTAKLAFRNDLTGNLAFIDYSAETLAATEIEDTIDVYHPDISPDGNFVAFCTGLEGISGKSNLYVRRLDAQGSGLVKLDVESAAIPRFHILDGDTVIVYVTDAGNNKEASAFRSKST